MPRRPRCDSLSARRSRRRGSAISRWSFRSKRRLGRCRSLVAASAGARREACARSQRIRTRPARRGRKKLRRAHLRRTPRSTRRSSSIFLPKLRHRPCRHLRPRLRRRLPLPHNLLRRNPLRPSRSRRCSGRTSNRRRKLRNQLRLLLGRRFSQRLIAKRSSTRSSSAERAPRYVFRRDRLHTSALSSKVRGEKLVSPRAGFPFLGTALFFCLRDARQWPHPDDQLHNRSPGLQKRVVATRMPSFSHKPPCTPRVPLITRRALQATPNLPDRSGRWQVCARPSSRSRWLMGYLSST